MEMVLAVLTVLTVLTVRMILLKEIGLSFSPRQFLRVHHGHGEHLGSWQGRLAFTSQVVQ